MSLADRIENLAEKASPGPYHRHSKSAGKWRISRAPEPGSGTDRDHTLCIVYAFKGKTHARLLCELLNNLPAIVAALRKA